MHPGQYYGPPAYAYTPYGGGPLPGQPVPPQLVGAPPPPGLKVVQRAKVSASIALPLVGLLIVGLICPTLPWYDAGQQTFNLWDLTGNVWDLGSDAMKTYSANYFGWLWIVLVVWAFFLSMAGTADNAAWRIVYGVVYCLIGVVVGGIMLLTVLGVGLLAGSTGTETDNSKAGAALGVGAVLLLIGLVVFVVGAVLLFKLHGVAYRILAGLGLLSFALVHLSALLSLPEGADVEPWAYLSIVGYTLCAVGCFIGPRYVRYYARA